MRKYRFKEEHKDAQIAIPGIRSLVTNFNLTDELAELVLKKFKKFAHNIELIPPGQSAEDYGTPKKITVPKQLRKYTGSELKPETKTPKAPKPPKAPKAPKPPTKNE